MDPRASFKGDIFDHTLPGGMCKGGFLFLFAIRGVIK